MSYADRSNHPQNPQTGGPQEPAGTVTADSLAAESLNNSGDFARGGAAPQSVPSYATTANTTDTQGATKLPPTDYARDRLSDEPELGLQGDQGSSRAYDTTRGGPQESYAGEAPSSMGGDSYMGPGQARPKGKNITEGGFDPDAPNASFNNEIGTKNDPGRYGEAQNQRANAREGFDAGYDGASVGADGGSGKGGFENLRETNA